LVEPAALEPVPHDDDGVVEVEGVEHPVRFGIPALEAECARQLGAQLTGLGGIHRGGERRADALLARGRIAEIPEVVEEGLRQGHPSILAHASA
jgi:hypothetical protein